MKLKLTKESELMFEKADEEPFYSINQANGISGDSFLLMLDEIGRFIPEFEAAIGLHGARTWMGERLNEAVNARRTTEELHLAGRYFSAFDIKSDTAHILIENYERAKEGRIRSKYCVYDFAVLRFMVTRPVHEDTHSHVHKTEYAELFSELVDKTRAKIEDKEPSEGLKIKEVPREFTAPIYVMEKEEQIARQMQRFALNAFLQAFYERDPEWYGLLGVPLFLPQNPGIMAEIRRITKGEVEFKSGFLSSYRKTLGDYACAIPKSREEIYDDASVYLLCNTEHLINVVRQCLEGDYSDLTICPVHNAPPRCIAKRDK